MIRCNSSQQCSHSWLSMVSTGNSTVRVCPQCQQDVHWVDSYEGFKMAAQKNQCVAFEPSSVLLTAEKAEVNLERKQFLLLEKQKLSLKQLTHVKKYIHPDWSLRDLRDSYHNKASIIKYDPNKNDVDEVANILRGIGMKVDVKREENA